MKATVRIAVTGANGLLGRALCERLSTTSGVALRAITRTGHHGLPDEKSIGELHGTTDWRRALQGVDALVHCAARVHKMGSDEQADQRAYEMVNLHGTRRLAECAAAAGVQRLVFISTIKVNGETAPPSRPFQAMDPPRPADLYARSKTDAEHSLWQVAAENSLEVVVIRPPLVHARGALGNLAILQQLIHRGIPLPLGCADNQRSVIGIDNLVDGVIHSVFHDQAPGKIWLMRDPTMPTVRQLIRELASAQGKSPRLFPVPRGALRSAGVLTGQQGRVSRLLDPLCMDIKATQEILGWQPPWSLEEGIARLTSPTETNK